MQNKMLQNDLKRNKLVTLTLVLFIACASLLASLAAALAVNLSDAINALMARAETPHFLQMHSGDIDMNSSAPLPRTTVTWINSRRSGS